MSTQHSFGTFNRDSGSLALQGATRTTGKLLASQGYVVGIDISASGARASGGLADLGLRPAVAWSTHPHWDHVLWSAGLGDAPRYAAPAAVALLETERGAMLEQLGQSAPGHDLELVGRMRPLAELVVPWDGPEARLIVHDGHAPGHGAVFLPDSGVLLAGDMCSDIEIPLLDTLRDDGTEVTSAVESREIKAALVSAVDGLPPQERTVISLYYFEGLTLKEIKGLLALMLLHDSRRNARIVDGEKRKSTTDTVASPFWHDVTFATRAAESAPPGGEGSLRSGRASAPSRAG